MILGGAKANFVPNKERKLYHKARLHLGVMRVLCQKQIFLLTGRWYGKTEVLLENKLKYGKV